MYTVRTSTVSIETIYLWFNLERRSKYEERLEEIYDVGREIKI